IGVLGGPDADQIEIQASNQDDHQHHQPADDEPATPKRGHEPSSAAHGPRTTSRVGSSTRSAGASASRMDVSSSRAATRPISSSGWRTVVSGGGGEAACGVSSEPSG